MARGANYCNNNKGVSLQGSKRNRNDQMPMCQYGAGCTRKSCIYRHPDKKTDAQFVQSKEPCMAYLAGICAFSTKGCRKRHPGKEEADRFIEKYQTVRCRFEDTCRTDGCLYLHPSDGQWEPTFFEMPTAAVVAPTSSMINTLTGKPFVPMFPMHASGVPPANPMPPHALPSINPTAVPAPVTNEFADAPFVPHFQEYDPGTVPSFSQEQASPQYPISASWGFNDHYEASYVPMASQHTSIDNQNGTNANAREFVPGNWKS